MQNKLQELTDKLYNEGLSKGKQEAEELKAKALREADKIVSKAKDDAAAIVAKAEKEAEEIITRADNDVKMASNQAISAVRQQVEKMVVTKTITPVVQDAMTDTKLIKSVITTIAGAFNAANPDSVALEIILPQSMKSELEDFLKKEINGTLCKGLEVKYVKGISHGFKIGPKDGGYMISFTDDDFNAMISGYLRPATRRILFGE
ncbi:MAG: hypothetical protein GX993_01015 [Bacteroidales bacterium]|nr:hypothetical protein [Bacteroidales bacterium]